MAKPICVVKLPNYTATEKHVFVREALTEQLIDYHVIVVKTCQESVTFETHNDVSGLSDVQISELINSLKLEN